MSQVVIENPVINSPFDEPRRHFRFTDEGITNEIAEARRVEPLQYRQPLLRPARDRQDRHQGHQSLRG